MGPSDVLSFWFEELTPNQWFEKDEALDARMRESFGALVEKVARDETASWRDTPEGRLAEVIVLDQLTRNIFRDDPRAFKYDDVALQRAQEAIEVGDDTQLEPIKRRFLYMPFMHSESKEVHEQAVQLFEALGDEETLKYEHKHKDIIDQFGRYPHRNAVLGRDSTPEEVEFLQTHDGF